jgi:hypothetical protein
VAVSNVDGPSRGLSSAYGPVLPSEDVCTASHGARWHEIQAIVGDDEVYVVGDCELVVVGDGRVRCWKVMMAWWWWVVISFGGRRRVADNE